MRPCLDPVALAANCRMEAYRGPGPGGQKRNKTSSAVRVTHIPTGLCATAAESRSQAENRRLATGRLRLRIALEVRNPIPMEGPPLPEWFSAGALSAGRLKTISLRDEQYVEIVGVIFDLLHHTAGALAECAKILGVGTANLARFLQRDEVLMQEVNRVRKAAGLKTLGGARD